VSPTESVAVTWKVKLLKMVGMPDNTPVLFVSVSGRWEVKPWVTAKVNSPLPPVALIV